MRVAINGYGRIGSCLLRAWLERGLEKEISLVAINDLADKDVIAHLTRYDSTHGRISKPIEVNDNQMTVGSNVIELLHVENPQQFPWADLGVDLVFECSGAFKTHASASTHLEAGAAKVIVSAPMKDADVTVVLGVNDQDLQPGHAIISNASCTTNCLAPVAKALNDAIGIRSGIMTTIHAYTNDQSLLDRSHKDLYRARAAGMSMIPTSTGAAEAVGRVLPELAGKLTGMAVRVPTPNVSLVDLHWVPERATSVEEINAAVLAAAQNSMEGILGYNTRPLVSVDFNHHPASSIFDASHTEVIGDQARVMSWYDNEWGFTNRLLDLALKLKA